MRVAICDDDHAYLLQCEEKLRQLEEKYGSFLNITFYQTGEQLLFDLEDGKEFDLIYMDVSLPGRDGMEIAYQLRKQENDCEIIFLTGRTEKWHGAFDVEAVHYIIKGWTEEKYFESAFVRALDRIKRKRDERIVFTCANESRNILISDIRYFEVNRNIVTVHYGNDSVFEFYTPLSRLQTVLERYTFIKTHQSYLVALSYIRELRKNDLLLKNGESIPISRTYRKAVIKALKQQSCGCCSEVEVEE